MKKKYRKYPLYLSLLVCTVLCLSISLFSFLEKRILPSLREISHMQCKSFANEFIDSAILRNLEEIDTTALLIQSEESYTANTALVNQFCAQLSKEITNGLNQLPDEVIRIPIGAASNISFFANLGPEIPYTLLPMGAVKVDYDTDFASVGINQINYKIWLNISLELKIVNPLYQETVLMERRLMLADLVFGGKVPEHYLQINP